ncbi:MAG: pyridoxamine 5'-phosphate oxidase [Pirellulales bacterium]|nr:pyridoxamine 5'-phosphate oxidase [Pirellulales bacterium]
MSIKKMRRAYQLDGLHEKDIDSDPMVQFQSWFSEALQSDRPAWMEINAMTLSTADPSSGAVSSRVVLLKGIQQGRLLFFTNYDSDKALHIAANPLVALCFFWPHLERQVRVEGLAAKSERQISVDYFHSRPRDSQLGAHVSVQSQPVPGREGLEQRMAQLQQQYADQEVPCPENWGGYEVQPTRFEFWQGRPSRLHDRLCYQQEQSGRWSVVRLSP